MTENKISVIVPMFNSQRYIKRCITSLMNQTYENIEIIVVDDGSLDNSKDIVNKLLKDDNRIRLFTKENGGVASARNLGLQVVTGDIISFVDSDDFVDSEMYSVMVNKLNMYDADIVECGYKKIHKDKVLTFEMTDEVIESSSNILKHYLAGVNTKNYNCNKLYRKKLFDNVIYEKLSYSEDYLVNIKTHAISKRKVIIRNPFYNYFDNTNSAVNAPFSNKRIDQIKAGVFAFEFLKKGKFNNLILSYALSYILEMCVDLYKNYSDEQLFKENRKMVLHEYRKYFRKFVKYKNIHKIYSSRLIYSRIVFYLSPTIFEMISKLNFLNK